MTKQLRKADTNYQNQEWKRGKTDSIKIKRIIKEHYEQFLINKLKNLH